MRIRTILVPFNVARDDKAAFLRVFSVAEALKAHVQVVFVRQDPDEVFVYLGMDVESPSELREYTRKRVEEEGKLAALRSRRHFNAACKDMGLVKSKKPTDSIAASAHWEQEFGEPTEIIPERAKLSDVAVFVGGLARYSRSSRNVLKATVIQSGRPVILVPDAVTAPSFSSITVAWDASPCCVRAVAAALPILAKASRVQIVSITEPHDKAPEPEKLVRFLEWHGIQATADVLPAQGRRVGELILESAATNTSGLVILGGYGHGRYVETVFGGTTSYVIRKSDIPFLLMH
ncbi:Universal stress protein family protein [Roseovarius litorisediminis]|uniref:Universal stress protein family protein n=1 Tax=Roseovarius litorisediminis TaxID=1312363 RepID=A0A1Y5S1T0_9RHOB|nr:universal stress protein [Roseovarius litorisediminis]SLN30677.1 Universal stress protein family protein [Roseovarius litorisediminis]